MKKYNSNITLGSATLNVNDLAKQLNFYTDAMGMSIISQDDNTASLGTKDGKILLNLNKVDATFVRSYGLYHIAYLVPSEQDLANILKHFVKSKTALIGGSDHGYSNALYLEDVEGNGIEVYYDKDESLWDKKEDGRIIGVTEPIDAEHLLNISNDVIPYELPVGTVIGHIHLSVKDSKESTEFYQHILGFKDKFTVPSASWIAYGDYHHHLAVNNWGGPNLNLRKKGTPGLANFNIIFDDSNVFKTIKNNIENNSVVILEKTENSLIIEDPNGISFTLINA